MAITDYMRNTNIAGPAVLLGDLNTESDSPVIKYLNINSSLSNNYNNYRYINYNDDIELIDAWEADTNHAADDGNTFCTLHQNLTKRVIHVN
jgi:hypothetical protein